MKKLSATTMENGKTKTVSVWLDDRTAQALEQANDEEFTRQYILDEHKSKLIDLKETRRHMSLDAYIDNGFDVPDEYCLEDDIIANADVEFLLNGLTPEQRGLFERIVMYGLTQKEIAEENGVSTTAVFNRLNKIFKKIRKKFESAG